MFTVRSLLNILCLRGKLFVSKGVGLGRELNQSLKDCPGDGCLVRWLGIEQEEKGVRE